ncbi:unknown [Fusobacterium sp. CAG:439]|nr:unknown [Fusobacterium sp. CAG:439]
MIDLNSKYYNLYNDKLFYYLLTGKSYGKIAEKYYSYDINKLIYRIRKLKKELSLSNRRQLAYFAVENKLVDIEKVKLYF